MGIKEMADDAHPKNRAQKTKGPRVTTRPLLFTACSGSPTWTRTRDLRINSPSLYQLSYQGSEAELYTRIIKLSRCNHYRREKHGLMALTRTQAPSPDATFAITRPSRLIS